MGRAGQGGYGTVQHAYDTRLKRDVAIKCIKITQADMARSRFSIHDAQIENATRALSPANRKGLGGRGQLAPESQEPESGFRPLTVQISEPSFFSTREKNAVKRARRRDFMKNANRAAGNQGIAGGHNVAGAPNVNGARGNWAAGVNHGAVGKYSAGAGRGARSASEAFENSEDASYLDDFAGYKNFKGSNKRGRRGKAQKGGAELLPSEFAGGIPGMIAGAGQADIDAVGENSIALGSLGASSNLSKSSDVSGSLSGENGSEDIGAFTNMPRRSQLQDGRRGGRNTPQSRRPVSQLQVAFNESEREEFASEPEGDKLANVNRIPGLEEARTAAHLNDANIVTVYDCVVEGDMAYVIMEYVEGKTLARVMRDLGNDITLDMIAYIFTSVSHALEVAHKAGILHLDIKPENVIINNEGTVKVTDFGLSTLMDASGQGETGGGTIGYMPLEQMRQQRLDVRTDEWGLASLTYEMLSGKNPFKARSLADAEGAIIEAELVIPSLCWEEIDESVDDIMFTALSPLQEGRYPDIKSFAGELTPLLGNSREGKEQLSKAVANPLPVREDRKPKQDKPHIPFIDKLGVKGSSVLMRIFSALGVAMIAIMAMINVHFGFGAETGAVHTASEGMQSIEAGVETTFGLFSVLPIVAWVILAAVIAVAVIWPRFAMPAGYALMVLMFFFNQAPLPGILLLAATGAWWWFYGRESDMMCMLVMTQPLFGSIGFGAVAPVLAGALLDVKDALLTAAMMIVSAFAFATLGSTSIINWDIAANFAVAVDPSISGAALTASFAKALSSPANWAMALSWAGAAGAYSLLCRRGTHSFDILGGVAAGILVVAGAIVVPILTGNASMLPPNVIGGLVIAFAVSVVLAIMNVPDRVRMAPGEW